MFLKLFSALLLIKRTSAFNIEVTDYYCQQRSVTAEFTQFCNASNTCAFGEEALVSGYLNLTSVVADSWGVDADSIVYLDSKIHISSYFQQQVLNMKAVSLCNETGLSAYVDDGDDGNGIQCPSAGLYSFTELPLQLPSISNRVFDWAATGWTGTATIDMYLDESKYNLIGRCKLDIITHSDTATNDEGNDDYLNSILQQIPDAKATGMIFFGSFAALTFLCCVCSYMCCSSSSINDGDTNYDSDGTDFTRMGLAESA